MGVNKRVSRIEHSRASSPRTNALRAPVTPKRQVVAQRSFANLLLSAMTVGCPVSGTANWRRSATSALCKRLQHPRSHRGAIVIELQIRLGFEPNREVEREIPVRRLREREDRAPVVEIT